MTSFSSLTNYPVELLVQHKIGVNEWRRDRPVNLCERSLETERPIMFIYFLLFGVGNRQIMKIK